MRRLFNLAVTDLGWMAVTGYILAILTYAVLVVACFQIDSTSRLLNILILVFGGLLGWTIGILATPRDASERAQFSAYVAGVSTFLSGFVVAKVDKLYELNVGKLSLTADSLSRLLLFGSAFLLGLLCVYIGRSGRNPPAPVEPLQGPR